MMAWVSIVLSVIICSKSTLILKPEVVVSATTLVAGVSPKKHKGIKNSRTKGERILLYLNKIFFK